MGIPLMAGTVMAQTEIHYEGEGIVISSELEDCSDAANGTSNMLRLLTVTNNNDHDVEVRFTKRMWFGDRCIGCNESNPEQEVTVNLSAGAASSGVCGDRVSRLLVFHSMKDNASVQRLSSFTVAGVSVMTLQSSAE